jgi:hypothetical protein
VVTPRLVLLCMLVASLVALSAFVGEGPIKPF